MAPTITDREYLEIRRNKAWLDKNDIMERYGVGIGAAYGILRGIKQVCGGGQLPCGKVLPAELEYWENYRRMVEQEERNAEKVH